MTAKAVAVQSRSRAQAATLTRHLGSLAGTGTLAVLGTLTGVLLARGLGVHDRGVFAAILLWPSVLLVLADVGVSNALVFFAAREPRTTPWLLRSGFKLAALQSLVGVPIAAGVTWLALGASGVHNQVPGVMLAAAFLPSGLLGLHVAAVMQGRLRLMAYYGVRASLQLATLVALLALALSGTLTLWTAVLGQIAALAVSALVSIVLAGSELQRDSETREVGRMRPLLSYGARSFAGGLYPIEVLMLDQIVVALFLGPSDLGLYVVAVTLTTIVRIVALAIGVIASPQLAQTSPAHRPAKTRRFLFLTAAIVVPLAAGLFLLTPELLRAFFGGEFAGATTASRLLLVGSVGFGMRRVLGDCLRGEARAGRVSIVETATWPAAALAILVGSSHGIDGVAAGIAILQLGSATALAIVAWRGHASDVQADPRGQSNFRSRGIVLAGATAVATASGAAVAVVHGRTALVILVGLVCVMPIGVRLIQGRFDIFEPIVPISIGLLLIFFVRPLAHITSGEWFFRGFDIRDGFDTALVMALLGILGLFVGYSLVRFARAIASRLPVLAPKWTTGQAHRFTFLLLGAAALLFAGYILQLGGIGAARSFLTGRTTADGLVRADASAYLYFGPFLAIPGALILMEVASIRRRMVTLLAGFFAALFVVVVTVPRGDRIWLSTLLISLVIARSLRRGRRPKLPAVLISVVLFVVGVNVLLSQRVTEDRQGPASNAVTRALTTPRDQFKSFALGPDLSMFSVLSITAEEVPAQIPHRPGSTLASLLVAPLPEFVWHGKPQAADVILYTELFPKQGALTRAGTSPSFFGGLYFDGGYLLMVLGGILTGLLARVLFEWWRLYPGNASIRLVYSTSLPLLVVFLRGSPTDLFGRALFVVGPVLVFGWLVRARPHVVPARTGTLAATPHTST